MKLLRYLLLFLSFGITLYADPNINSSFDLAKATLLRLVLILLLFLFILRGFRLSLPLLHIPVILFFFWTTLSCLLGILPKTSILGSYGRNEGLISFLCYVLLFYLGANLFNDKKSQKLFIYAYILVGVLPAIYGIIQYFGLDPIVWSEEVRHRVTSTIGNPNFLGAHLIMVLPFALLLYLSKRISNLGKVVVFFALFFLLFSLLLTQNRGGWVGFIMALTFIFAFAAPDLFLRYRMVLLRLIPVVLFSSIIFLVLIKNPATSPIKRILSEIEEKNQQPTSEYVIAGREVGGTIKARLMWWSIARKLIADFPLFGIGLDTLGSIFSSYNTYDLVRAGYRSRIDRFHNDIFDTSATRGIIGLFLYIWLIFAFFGIFIKVAKKELKENILILGFPAAIVAYLTQNLFSFGVLPYSAFFWLILGIALPAKPKINKFKKFNLFKTAFLLLLSLAAAFVSIRYIADWHYNKAKKNKYLGRLKEAEISLKKAQKLSPWEPFYHWELGMLYQDMAENIEILDKKLYFYSEAIEELLKVKDFDPYNSSVYNQLGMLYYFCYSLNSSEEDGALAEKYYEAALEKDRYFVEAHSNLAILLQNYKKGKNWQRAIYHFLQAQKLAPGSQDYLTAVANIYYMNKDYAKAKKYYIAALKETKRPQDIYLRLGEIYYKEKDIEKAKEYYRKVLDIEANNELAQEWLNFLKR